MKYSCLQYYVCASSVYSLAYFLPVILRDGLGFDYKLSLILTSPPYVSTPVKIHFTYHNWSSLQIATIFFSLIMARLSDKYRLRWPLVHLPSLGLDIEADMDLKISLWPIISCVRIERAAKLQNIFSNTSYRIVGLLIVLYATPAGVRLFGWEVTEFTVKKVSNFSQYLPCSMGNSGKRVRVSNHLLNCQVTDILSQVLELSHMVKTRRCAKRRGVLYPQLW